MEKVSNMPPTSSWGALPQQDSIKDPATGPCPQAKRPYPYAASMAVCGWPAGVYLVFLVVYEYILLLLLHKVASSSRNFSHDFGHLLKSTKLRSRARQTGR